MIIDITSMPGAPNPSTGDWLQAFYEAQLSMRDNPEGGGVIYFPSGIYHFSNTLQIFGAPIIRGEGPNNTFLLVNAPFAPHPFDSGLLLPADGMIVHANYGTEGTGRFLNHPTLPTGPAINFVWTSGYDVSELLAAPFITNAEPTLEDFSLYYNNTTESFQNTKDPELGFGHGIVIHKRIAINNCIISGFPGDGIRIVGTNLQSFFLEGRRIWGLFYEIDGIWITNPPDIQHEENQHTPDPEDLLPVNYIDFRFLNYFELDPTPVITKNLSTDLDIQFFDDDSKSVLDDNPELENLEIEILIGGIEFATLLLPFLNVDFGTPSATGPADSVEIHVLADTTSFPFGEIPIRIKATYESDSGTKIAVSEVFYIYACDNIHNAYPKHVNTNANVSQIYNTSIRLCKRNGLYVAGIDSNAGAIVSLTATHNGNWGIYENSALGNTYMGCHCESNGSGAYITGLASGSDVNRNIFIGCTGEGKVLVENPSQWIGGSSEQVPYYFPSGVWKNEASTLQQGGIFPLYRQVVRFRNSTGIDADPEAGVAGDSGVFFEVGPNAPEDLFGFGIVTREWAMSVKMLDNIASGKSKYYAFNEANADAGIALSLSGLLTGGEIPPGMPYFFNPILMSKNDEEGEKKIRITVGPGAPIGEAVHDVEGVAVTVIDPLTEEEVFLNKIIGNVGDIHFNSNPLYLGEDANNLERDNVAWICTESFIFDAETPSASIEAVWKPFWFINPS